MRKLLLLLLVNSFALMSYTQGGSIDGPRNVKVGETATYYYYPSPIPNKPDHQMYHTSASHGRGTAALWEIDWLFPKNRYIFSITWTSATTNGEVYVNFTNGTKPVTLGGIKVVDPNTGGSGTGGSSSTQPIFLNGPSILIQNFEATYYKTYNDGIKSTSQGSEILKSSNEVTVTGNGTSFYKSSELYVKAGWESSEVVEFSVSHGLTGTSAITGREYSGYGSRKVEVKRLNLHIPQIICIGSPFYPEIDNVDALLQYAPNTKAEWTLPSGIRCLSDCETVKPKLIAEKGDLGSNNVFVIVKNETEKGNTDGQLLYAKSPSPSPIITIDGDDKVLELGKLYSYILSPSAIITSQKPTTTEWTADENILKIESPSKDRCTISLNPNRPINVTQTTLKAIVKQQHDNRIIEIHCERVIKIPSINLKLADINPVNVGQNFTCSLLNFEDSKKAFPNLKIEWEYRNDFMGIDMETQIIEQVHLDANTNKVMCKGLFDGVGKVIAYVIVNNQRMQVGGDNGHKLVNIGAPFITVRLGVSGFTLFLGNIPKDYCFDKWKKVNENNDNYSLPYNFITAKAGVLDAQISMSNLNGELNSNAKICAVLRNTKDNSTMEIIANLNPQQAARSAFTAPLSFSAPTTFSVKVYSLYSTKPLHQEVNVESFDIYNTNLREGLYVIEKTMSDGTVTKERVYKNNY